mmetsp:Transcript_9379/g.42755  ORF Transcript_9379/g.42755 Transcript_9379/m.42755 type:complete len:214 (+) Transcript_9379:4175-4816(+)
MSSLTSASSAATSDASLSSAAAFASSAWVKASRNSRTLSLESTCDSSFMVKVSAPCAEASAAAAAAAAASACFNLASASESSTCLAESSATAPARDFSAALAAFFKTAHCCSRSLALREFLARSTWDSRSLDSASATRCSRSLSFAAESLPDDLCRSTESFSSRLSCSCFLTMASSSADAFCAMSCASTDFFFSTRRSSRIARRVSLNATSSS